MLHELWRNRNALILTIISCEVAIKKPKNKTENAEVTVESFEY